MGAEIALLCRTQPIIEASRNVSVGMRLWECVRSPDGAVCAQRCQYTHAIVLHTLSFRLPFCRFYFPVAGWTHMLRPGVSISGRCVCVCARARACDGR